MLADFTVIEFEFLQSFPIRWGLFVLLLLLQTVLVLAISLSTFLLGCLAFSLLRGRGRRGYRVSEQLSG